MSTAIITLGLRRHWRGPVITAVVLGLLLILELSVYQGMADDVLTTLPKEYLALLGVPEGASLGSLAYNGFLGSMGALAVGGLAISWGSRAIAREEQEGTLSLQLASPLSRTRLLTSKIVVMLLHLAITALGLWGIGELAPLLLDIELGEAHIGALMLHVTVNACFYGFMAMGIGAATGRPGLGSGIAALIMTLSFFLHGLLAAVPDYKEYTEYVPWHYLTGSSPFLNGVEWNHIAILAAGAVVFVITAYLVFPRRDLRSQSTPLLTKLAKSPLLRRLEELSSRGGKPTGIIGKQISRHVVLGFIVIATMFGLMGVLVGGMYPMLDDTISSLADNLTPDLLKLFGATEMSTPEGYYRTQTMGMMAPVAVILLTTAAANAGIAGLEKRRQIGLLLSHPIARWRIVAAALVSATVWNVLVSAGTFAGLAAGNVLGDMGISYWKLAAACAMMAALGWFFTGVTLLLAAATGRPGVAVWGTVGIAVISYMVNVSLQLQDDLIDWAKVSPFYWYADNEPLVNGLDWGNFGVLVGVGALLMALAFLAYQRRDLRLRQ